MVIFIGNKKEYNLYFKRNNFIFSGYLIVFFYVYFVRKVEWNEVLGILREVRGERYLIVKIFYYLGVSIFLILIYKFFKMIKILNYFVNFFILV